jgi:GAF domain-containing protein
MKWIFDHFQLVLAIAGGIAYWLTQRREAAAAREAEKNPQPASMAEADDETRAEQVREEIRRKIAARRAGTALPEPALPEPVSKERWPMESVPEPRFELPPVLRPRPAVGPTDTFGGPMIPALRRRDEAPQVEVSPVAVATETLEASLERQEQLAIKLQELADQRALAERRAAAVVVTQAAVARHALAGDELRRDLRDPRSLRRAMILREVLGAPVGLR